MHKCPNCGEILDSFISRCPLCDCEIRSNEVSSALKKFKDELEAIDRKNSGYNYRYLKNLNEDDEKSKIKRKIELIENYPIPNNKEDIKEFMILASSNFDANVYNKNLEVEDISDAWLAKIKQCYQKASLILENEDFEKIQEMYSKIMKSIEETKKSKIIENIKPVLLKIKEVFSRPGFTITAILLGSYEIYRISCSDFSGVDIVMSSIILLCAYFITKKNAKENKDK